MHFTGSLRSTRGEEEAAHCANRKSLFLSEIQESVSTYTHTVLNIATVTQPGMPFFLLSSLTLAPS